ncbi:MAG TPA: hypothetical protein VHL80_14290 [Polyangia bacterium]|nr:hypothetical protein [Polyangia bacterium]
MSGPGRPSALGGWWRASLRARSLLDVLRGFSPVVPVASAGLILSGCGDVLSQEPTEPGAALDDQRNLGWDVGAENEPLVLDGAQAFDVAASARWREAMPNLATSLAPAGARWWPYYAPALFQSLEAPRSAGLRFEMYPVFTPDMALAHRRGEALLSLLLDANGCRSDVAIVLDLPGPESVAVAAALAPCLDPVFVFDNWPHPRGVVPAQSTLGAALYFLPSFERDRGDRVRAAREAPPMFVLDRRRLTPYGDDPTRFDNRYFASLPPREALQAAGIRHVLYVTPDATVTLESDDLNDDLVTLADGGVDVRMLALSDFSETPLPGWPVDPSCPGAAAAPVAGLYFGGSAGAHACFSFWYGWRLPAPGEVVASFPRAGLPPPLYARCHFHPLARPTFAAAAHSGGWRTGVFGHSRSGSLGRIHSGSWG